MWWVDLRDFEIKYLEADKKKSSSIALVFWFCWIDGCLFNKKISACQRLYCFRYQRDRFLFYSIFINLSKAELMQLNYIVWWCFFPRGKFQWSSNVTKNNSYFIWFIDIVEVFGQDKSTYITADELFYFLDCLFRGLSKILVRNNEAKPF